MRGWQKSHWEPAYSDSKYETDGDSHEHHAAHQAADADEATETATAAIPPTALTVKWRQAIEKEWP